MSKCYHGRSRCYSCKGKGAPGGLMCVVCLGTGQVSMPTLWDKDLKVMVCAKCEQVIR